ncbi:dynein light chain Tctex-type protein 2B-like [Babylonia areolata]|uniref:dynein light chain Tctex-type protein 2B-like n=1 Tax=Babylonia areolata TaxID=304850 RepID=UPI003FD31947
MQVVLSQMWNHAALKLNEKPLQRQSVVAEFDDRGHRLDHRPRLENTYRLGPDPEETFKPHLVKPIMENILQDHLKGQVYNQPACRKLCKKVAGKIKLAMKAYEGISKRYKFVSQVSIGENRKQGVQVASRCLWNAATDNFASAAFTSDELFAVAVLYAVYMD